MKKFPALCLFAAIMFISMQMGAAIPANERAALIALYNQTNGDKGNTIFLSRPAICCLSAPMAGHN